MYVKFNMCCRFPANRYNYNMPDESKHKGWGGKRPGSGPKPKPEYGEYLTQRLDLRLTQSQHDHLKSRAEAEGVSMAEYLRRLVAADMSQQP